MILNNLGRYQEALEAYYSLFIITINYFSCNYAIQINQNYDPAWNNKGNTLNDLERYQEALEAYYSSY